MPTHWVEINGVEWHGGERDGERCIRFVASDGKRRVYAYLDAKSARGVARLINQNAKWATDGLPKANRGTIVGRG